jgi:hypothetical protein
MFGFAWGTKVPITVPAEIVHSQRYDSETDSSIDSKIGCLEGQSQKVVLDSEI